MRKISYFILVVSVAAFVISCSGSNPANPWAPPDNYYETPYHHGYPGPGITGGTGGG